MFEACLFDLDDTLVSTSDLEEIRILGKNNSSDGYINSLKLSLKKIQNRSIYSEKNILELRNEFQDIKFGIFTRAPRSYTEFILSELFPNVQWDAIVCREDVEKTKPYGDGIWRAMEILNIDQLDRVLLVGDGDNDIRSAYNAGISVALDTASWAASYDRDNWRAISHMPDAIFSGHEALRSILRCLHAFQPELERALSPSATVSQNPPRFDRIGKFIPREAGGDSTVFHVHSGGRSFANYKSLSERRKWHILSQSIQDNKDADTFPVEWIATLTAFIKHQFPLLGLAREPLVVTVVPHRPGRRPRLESLLTQLKAASSADPFFAGNGISIEPGLLAYRDGVRSHSKEFLNAVERFENVRDYLYVQKPDAVAGGRRVLVLDDVCSSGASLIYAGKHLKDAGASAITRFAIAMNISDVLPHE